MKFKFGTPLQLWWVSWCFNLYSKGATYFSGLVLSSQGIVNSTTVFPEVHQFICVVHFSDDVFNEIFGAKAGDQKSGILQISNKPWSSIKPIYRAESDGRKSCGLGRMHY